MSSKGLDDAWTYKRDYQKDTGAILFMWRGNPYVTIKDGMREKTLSVNSDVFKGHIRNHFLIGKNGDYLPEPYLTEIVNMFSADALFAGVKKQVFKRKGFIGKQSVIDMHNVRGEFRIIDASGVKQTLASPVPFASHFTMLPLPGSERVGNKATFKLFREAYTFEDERDAIIPLAIILDCLSFGYKKDFSLNFEGLAGSGKSEAAKRTKAFMDPTDPMICVRPVSFENLRVNANSMWVQAYDIANGVCPNLEILLDGGGYLKRELHSDDTAIRYDFDNPVILAGLARSKLPPNLQRKVLSIKLSKHSKNWKGSGSCDQAFEKIYGKIVTGLHWLLSDCYRILPEIQFPHISNLERMALAAEKVLALPDGAFYEAFNRNFGTQDNFEKLDQSICEFLSEYLKDLKDNPVGGKDFIYGNSSDIKELFKGTGLPIPKSSAVFGKKLISLECQLAKYNIEILTEPTPGFRGKIIRFKEVTDGL